MESKEFTPYRIFIGSSSEELDTARYLQDALRREKVAGKSKYNCKVWDQGVFQAGRNTIDELATEARRSKFAVLVFAPDDIAIKRTVKSYVPRDNVVFELGIFLGLLGKERTYVVYCKSKKIDILSDLAGVGLIAYDEPADDTGMALQSVMAPVALRINEAVARVELESLKIQPSSTDPSEGESAYDILDEIVARDNKNLVESDIVRFQQSRYITPSQYGKLRKRFLTRRRRQAN